MIYIRLSHFTLFFLIELSPFNHSCSWVVGVHKKNFSVIDQKLTFSERFSFAHFLQGKKGQNKPKVPIFGPKKALRVAKSKF